MGALEKEKFWMCFTPYKPEIVGQKEKIIFGPTTLHGDAIRMKCQQLGIDFDSQFIEETLEIVRKRIKEQKFLTDAELESLIKKNVR